MIYLIIRLFFVIYIVISDFSARLDLCKSAFRHFNTEHNVDNHNLDTSPQTPSYIEVYDKNGATTKCWGISRYLSVDNNNGLTIYNSGIDCAISD